MSAILGWFAGRGNLGPKSFLLLTIGGYLLTGASNGLNQVIEKRVDGLMERTAERPLPLAHGTLAAILYSVLAGVIGLGCLFTLNPLSGWLGVAALVSYAFIYTPLKSRSTLSVFVGAFPGALPPMIGYVAATRTSASNLGRCLLFSSCGSSRISGPSLGRPRRPPESWVPHAALQPDEPKKALGKS